MRRHLGQRSYTRPLMMTEYQDKYTPPRCHTAQCLGPKSTQLYQQQLKTLNTSRQEKQDNGTSGRDDNGGTDQGRTIEMPTFRSFYMASKWVNHPSHLPPVAACCNRSCCCDQFCAMCKKVAKENNTTVYTHDYQAWKLSKRQPYKLHDNLKVFKGIGVTDSDGKDRTPIESSTSYKTSYVPHQVQPRKQLDKAFQTSQVKLAYPTCCGHCKTEPCPGMIHDFKAWTLEAKFPSPGKGGKKYDPNLYLSTTHSDFTTHKLSRTKPIIQKRGPGQEMSKAPFEGTTTMRDDYRAWDLPRRQSTTNKNGKKDWTRGENQTCFSRNEWNHCGTCHADYKPGDSCAQNGTIGFECVATEASGYLPRTADKDQSSHVHQMVTRMVSSARN